MAYTGASGDAYLRGDRPGQVRICREAFLWRVQPVYNVATLMFLGDGVRLRVSVLVSVSYVIPSRLSDSLYLDTVRPLGSV